MGFTHTLNRVNDFVVSNHRNHGHYLAFTNDFKGLLNELKGSKEGVSGGRGGSQVIFGENFISNGILGSTVSLATGISLGKKKLSDGGVVWARGSYMSLSTWRLYGNYLLFMS
jgi:TPP-dependent pyruvate/acetoin dehydrogenase alpha subunit